MAFTRKEKQLLHDDYFTVLREDDIYTEVQSKNTGHCWSIFKNMLEYGRRITLYHKHTKETKYYHKHRICMTVAEAVEQIKSHDDYVLTQQKVLEDGSGSEKRTLKIYGMNNRNYKEKPGILLKGDWLKKYGFNVGDAFDVLCENGKFVIVKA